jgi:hypothetical protein
MGSGDSARSSLATVSPGTSGSPRSRTTRSGAASAAIVIASAPEPVESTVKPARSRYVLMKSRSFRSSSTTSTVAAITPPVVAAAWRASIPSP